jgi:nicotinate-nucleotide adenylyltransferase
MKAAQAALAILELDELIFIPAGRPPHKELSENSAPGPHRLAMTRLMADGMRDARVSVSDLELERGGKSYTADTLRALHESRPQDELFLLMGTDMFLTLQDWREPQVICDLATLVPFARTESDTAEMFRIQGEYLNRTFGARICAIQLPKITELASTDLRKALCEDAPGEKLWSQVYGYILLNDLYGVTADLKHLPDAQLRAASYSMMKAKRIPHVRGCEDEAVKLALRWGCDPDLCRRAAILHDCTKYWELEEHLALCNQYGLELDELEQQASKLLHSKTGSLVARHLFGECDEICDAIYWHTTGRADMTLMEKILYIADYIEVTRDFPEVIPMRALAYEDLDAALYMGTQLTMEEMKEKKRVLHPNTVACHAQLKEKYSSLKWET